MMSRHAGGPPFSVQREDGEGTVVLALAGELDIAGTDRLLDAACAIPAGSSVTADVRELSFMDSSGLRALMNLDIRARDEGWSLTIAGPQPEVRRVLVLCGVEDRISISDDVP